MEDRYIISKYIKPKVMIRFIPVVVVIILFSISLGYDQKTYNWNGCFFSLALLLVGLLLLVKNYLSVIYVYENRLSYKTLFGEITIDFDYISDVCIKCNLKNRSYELTVKDDEGTLVIPKLHQFRRNDITWLYKLLIEKSGVICDMNHDELNRVKWLENQ